MRLWIEESTVNATEQHRIGDAFYETSCDTTGELYRQCLKEFGRCQGKVYIDRADRQAVQIGWTFLKREKYSDADDTYLHETWVTVHDQPPTVTKKHHYHEIGA